MTAATAKINTPERSASRSRKARDAAAVRKAGIVKPFAAKVASPAAITPDEVPVPSRAKSGSFSAAVADLEAGECTSRAFLINPEKSLGALVDDLSALREKCRDNTTPAVAQARKKTGGEYAIEMATCMTPANRFYIVAIVTRLT